MIPKNKPFKDMENLQRHQQGLQLQKFISQNNRSGEKPVKPMSQKTKLQTATHKLTN